MKMRESMSDKVVITPYGHRHRPYDMSEKGKSKRGVTVGQVLGFKKSLTVSYTKNLNNNVSFH
jgi:hypothetical protein